MILFLFIVIVFSPHKAFPETLNNAFNIFWHRIADHWSAETIFLLVCRSPISVNSDKLHEYKYFSLLAELLLDLLVLPSLGRRACPVTAVCVCALSRQKKESWKNHKPKRSLQTAALRGSDLCATHLYLVQPWPDFSFYYLLTF